MFNFTYLSFACNVHGHVNVIDIKNRRPMKTMLIVKNIWDFCLLPHFLLCVGLIFIFLWKHKSLQFPHQMCTTEYKNLNKFFMHKWYDNCFEYTCMYTNSREFEFFVCWWWFKYWRTTLHRSLNFSRGGGRGLFEKKFVFVLIGGGAMPKSGNFTMYI